MQEEDEQMSRNVPDLLLKYYLEEYKGVIENPSSLVAELLDQSKDLERVRELESRSLLSKKMRILEGGVGAGGTFIALLEQGYDVLGVEPDRRLFEITKKRLGQRYTNTILYNSAIGDFTIANDSIDLFISFQVLEHVNDLNKFFEDLSRVMKIGGKIFIAVPNYKFIWEPHYATIFPMFLGKKIFRMYLQIKGKNTSFLESLQFITPKRIRHLCNQYGFEVSDLGSEVFVDKMNNSFPLKYGQIGALNKIYIWILKIPFRKNIARIFSNFGFFYPIYLEAKKK